MLDLLIFGALETPKNPLIIEPEPIVIEEQVEPPKLTWQDNPQGCNEETQYIAAEEPFYCIDKQIPSLSSNVAYTGSQGATASNGWYAKGQCTWWVASKRPVGQWNNASDWLWQAKRDGYATGSQPRPGAIAWRSGHVAYVESVSGSQMTISEANYDYRGSVRTITVPISSYSAFIY